jgi:hypothetical protein
MQFAGILTDEVADQMLKDIYENRNSKGINFPI